MIVRTGLLFREGRTKGVGKLLSVEEDGLGPQPTIEVRIQPCPALVVTFLLGIQADCLVVIRLVLTLLSCDLLLSAFELDRKTPCSTLVVTFSCRHSS